MGQLPGDEPLEPRSGGAGLSHRGGRASLPPRTDAGGDGGKD